MEHFDIVSIRGAELLQREPELYGARIDAAMRIARATYAIILFLIFHFQSLPVIFVKFSSFAFQYGRFERMFSGRA